MLDRNNQIASKLGRTADGLLGRGPVSSNNDLYKSAARKALIEIANGSSSKRKFAWFFSSAAAAAVIAIIFIISTWESPPQARSFTIGNSNEHAAIGSFLRSAEGERISLTFEGGSHLELSDEGLARVVESTEDRVKLTMSHGNLKAWINADNRTEWVVEVSDFQITVHGTIFSVYRNPDEDSIRVEVEEGRVEVISKTTGKPGVMLNSGHSLIADATCGEIQIIETAKKGEPEKEGLDDEEDTCDGGLVVRDLAETRNMDSDTESHIATWNKKPTVNAEKTVPGWKLMVREGNAKSVVESSSDDEISKMGGDADIDELWLLGQAARLTKRTRAAKMLLLEIRERFSGSSRAAKAAFLLGKIAIDVEGDKNEARQMFKAYLNEAPNGSLAEDSLGQLLEISIQTGHAEEAKRLAQESLQRFPGGLYSKKAIDVLSE